MQSAVSLSPPRPPAAAASSVSFCASASVAGSPEKSVVVCAAVVAAIAVLSAVKAVCTRPFIDAGTVATNARASAIGWATSGRRGVAFRAAMPSSESAGVIEISAMTGPAFRAIFPAR